MSSPGVSTVLVVEDDGPTREMYRQALILAGYRVVAVPDGYDALQQIEIHRPAAVVLDLILPHVPGIDVYRDLRAQQETAHIPVVIVTGSDIRDVDPDALRYFLRKPIAPDALTATVGQAIRGIKRGEPLAT
jgi:CheY-like chemotaxis protein